MTFWKNKYKADLLPRMFYFTKKAKYSFHIPISFFSSEGNKAVMVLPLSCPSRQCILNKPGGKESVNL